MHRLGDHYKISFSYMWKNDEHSKKGERKPFACTCQLFKDDVLIAWENSRCSDKDHFQRALARTIALERSLKVYKELFAEKEINLIWDLYFKTFPKDEPIYHDFTIREAAYQAMKDWEF